MDELLADFVAETREMLEASAGEIVAWEADPANSARLDAIFRFVHTVKGNCGFFDLPRLASLSHAAEDALDDCRAGRREADGALVSAVLAIMDRITGMVDAIEAGEEYPEGGDEELVAALSPDAQLGETGGTPTPSAAAGATPAFGQKNPEVQTEQSEAVSAQEVKAARQPKASPPEPAPLPAAHKKADPVAVQRTIRLPVDLLDRVMSGVSDMVLARNDLAHRLRQAGTQPTIDGPFERLTSILADVRDAITRMRMQRIESLFSALPRLVRDLSSELGKQVLVDLEGGDVELDREMIEMVRDPMTHLIRNAVDHGMEPPKERLAAGKRETGILSIAARQSGNTISIVVSDDGRGLDEERIADKAVAKGMISPEERTNMSREKILQLIFEAGLSTAEKISNVSGRGVGLDVVRENLEKVGGSISVSSAKGSGTMFTLQIPLTLSIIAGLTVEVSGQRFAIPQNYIEEIIHASSRSLDFTWVGETAMVTFRGNRVPCLILNDVLGLGKSEVPTDQRNLVFLRLASGDLFALCVDQIHSDGDIVVKPLAPEVMNCGIYAGSTLLDDGEPVLLLDVNNIATEFDLVSDTRGRMLKSVLAEQDRSEKQAQRAMLFTDLGGNRKAVRLELVQRIETAPTATIDFSGGSARVVIDRKILPLIGATQEQMTGDLVYILRLTDGNCEILYAASQIHDVVKLSQDLKPVEEDPLIEAITLVGREPVALLDGHELFTRYAPLADTRPRPTCRLPQSEWARSILAPLIVSAGYLVAEDDETEEDIAIHFDEEGVAECEERAGRNVPVIRLRDAPADPGDGESIYRYDRDGLIDALNRAVAAGGE